MRKPPEKKPIKPKVVIFVEGGVVSEVLADTLDLEIMVVDFDNEDAGDKRERKFLPPVYGPTRIAEVERGED